MLNRKKYLPPVDGGSVGLGVVFGDVEHEPGSIKYFILICWLNVTPVIGILFEEM